VKSPLEHRLDTPGHRGKQTAVEQDREQQKLDWIKENAEGSTPVTRKEIKDDCTSQFNFKFSSRWAGSIRSFFAIGKKSLRQKVPAKKSSVGKYRDCFSNEQCRISMNMFRAVQLNGFSIWMKSAFQTGKIARPEQLLCPTGEHFLYHR
jgi:hypothetical protein